MKEACKNCIHCKELYTPPSMNNKAKHELCCTLFLNENSVMCLDSGKGMCECFEQKKEFAMQEIKNACMECCPICDEKKCVGRHRCIEIRRHIEIQREME